MLSINLLSIFFSISQCKNELPLNFAIFTVKFKLTAAYNYQSSCTSKATHTHGDIIAADFPARTPNYQRFEMYVCTLITSSDNTPSSRFPTLYPSTEITLLLFVLLPLLQFFLRVTSETRTVSYPPPTPTQPSSPLLIRAF